MKLANEFYAFDLASVHQADFSEIAKQAFYTIRPLLKKDSDIIDLGSGSGELGKLLTSEGHQYTGVEYSAPMIDIAKKLAPEATFIQRSFFDTPLFPCDAILSIGECLNYNFDSKNSMERLRDLFTRAYNVLPEKGILLFDLIGPGVAGPEGEYQKILDKPDYTIILHVTENIEDSSLERDIILFKKTNDHFRKSHEKHVVKLYKAPDIAKLLLEIGFQVETLRGYGDLVFRKNHVGFRATKR